MNTPQKIEYNNQRLLTTEQLADSYETTSKNIRDNFQNNKDKFVEGKHYFILQGDELKIFKNDAENFGLVGRNASQLYLYTKQGAARHSKMLGTDKAWDMFDVLEENYFNPRQTSPVDSYMINDPVKRATKWIEEEQRRQTLETQLHIDAPFTAFGKIVENSNGAIPIGEFAKILYDKNRIKMGRNQLFTWLRNNGYLMAYGRERNNPKQVYVQQGLFVSKPTVIARSIGQIQESTTLITGKGQIRITSELLAELEAKKKVQM